MDPRPRRSSAVLLMLFDRQDETYIVFTRRTNDVGTHKGQISLPGGAKEDSDASLLETALRETQEELGIDRGLIRIVGQLKDTPTHVSNFTITPFVARLAQPPAYRADPGEVAEVIEVPISALRDPDIHWEEARSDGSETRKVHYYRYGDTIIWGATARILMEFLGSEADLRGRDEANS